MDQVTLAAFQDELEKLSGAGESALRKGVHGAMELGGLGILAYPTIAKKMGKHVDEKTHDNAELAGLGTLAMPYLHDAAGYAMKKFTKRASVALRAAAAGATGAAIGGLVHKANKALDKYTNGPAQAPTQNKSASVHEKISKAYSNEEMALAHGSRDSHRAAQAGQKQAPVAPKLSPQAQSARHAELSSFTPQASAPKPVVNPHADVLAAEARRQAAKAKIMGNVAKPAVQAAKPGVISRIAATAGKFLKR